MSSSSSTAASGRWRPLSVSQNLQDSVAAEVRRLCGLQPPVRPERLAALHNPWSNTAALTNRWAFLDLCESIDIVRTITDIIGPDVILWDSQLYVTGADFASFAEAGREGRYWPVYPKAGAIALVSFGEPVQVLHGPLSAFGGVPIPLPSPREPLYVIRYIPASSKFVREPRYPANWIAMEEQVLLNYTTRALWLVAGEDRAGNDFVTGFSERTPSWKSPS